MNILLLEDDPLLSEQIATLLTKERYTCDVCHTVTEASGACDTNSYQLILMDWNLPDGSGVGFLRELRREGHTVPVIMLSGRERVEERVEALDSGADDYLCKPYSNAELLARVRALLRREGTQRTTRLQKGDVTLDLSRREVTVAQAPVALTPREFELLELLMTHKNQVLSRYQIAELLCKDFSALTSSNLVDVHVKNIRKKLNRPDIITTIRSVGYSVRE
jgi:DNA-binding response OmpR family regulator